MQNVQNVKNQVATRKRMYKTPITKPAKARETARKEEEDVTRVRAHIIIRRRLLQRGGCCDYTILFHAL